MNREMVDRRRALEALRAGVPNRDVVRMLPPEQPDLDAKIQALLAETEAGWDDGKQLPGLLLEGDFGTGKSHWLEYFRHLALESHFVVSTVVLNKETPLHDLTKLFRACVESAVIPGKVGPALEEIAHAYEIGGNAEFAELIEWLHQTPGLDPRYAATLCLFARNPSEYLREKVIAEWTGYPMRVSDLRAALREIEMQRYQIAAPQRGAMLQRFAFLTRFFRAAGYTGWAILFDETEMISKYSVRQRGKAYAHLAQLLGAVKGAATPGMATVFTITKDYTGQVLYGRKNDLEMIPARLQGTRDEELTAAAEIGMRTIKSKGVELRPPTRAQVQEIYRRVAALYTGAYDWQAPDIADVREYAASTGMRQYVRSWINAWDLCRLYQVKAEMVVETVATSYEEDTDLQTEAHDDDEPQIVL
ncbi:MAG: BREX system ATP-binding domain-containing protein [Armatimonadota bacterium]